MPFRTTRLCPVLVLLVALTACSTSSPTAPSAIVVAAQPQSQTVNAGAKASLTVAGTATAPLTYQWYVGASGSTSAAIAGATAASYETPVLMATTSYWVRLSDGTSTADSATAVITVVPQVTPNSNPSPAPPGSTAPSILEQPENETIASGATATLTVTVTGTAPFTYQWYLGASGLTSSPISGATSDRYTTAALTTNSSFWVRVANSGGTTDSSTATISIAPPSPPAPPPPPPGTAPSITSQPQSQTITAGQTASLSVSASGTSPLNYQWYSDGSAISGATSASYGTPSLSSTTSYWVRVANAHGSVDSATATITVTTAPDSSGAAWEDEVLALVNQRRAAGATCGGTLYAPAPALWMDANLRAAARGHSLDMATQNYFSHVSLDGRTFDQRIRNAGYGGAFPLGENIAAGQTSPQAVVDGWMNSPGHCQNIMSPGFKAIGVGYAFRSGSTYRHYWTQNFGGS
jgi:uncharacterized protein YkwD